MTVHHQQRKLAEIHLLIWGMATQRRSLSEQITVEHQVARNYIARYKAMRVPAEHSSPLEFWKENGQEFPLLAEVSASCASQPVLPSRRETSERSAAPLLTLVQGCRQKLLKQWNSFLGHGQCVVHCLTWMTNYLILVWPFLLAVLAIFYVVTLQLWWCVTEYFSSMGWVGLGWGNDGLGWVGLRKLDPWPCLLQTGMQ